MKPLSPLLIRILSVLCLGVILFLFYTLTIYSIRPGEKGGSSPQTLPRQCKAFHSPDKPTLIMFAHPKCPCSRASVGELAEIMGRLGDRVNTTVLFLRPNDFEEDWVKTDLWTQASAIPGVRTMIDTDGSEAKTFGCATSGHTLVYDQSGHLAFEGGITGSRAHYGDNDGADAVKAILLAKTPAMKSTAVYGCSLLDKPLSSGFVGFIKEQCQLRN